MVCSAKNVHAGIISSMRSKQRRQLIADYLTRNPLTLKALLRDDIEKIAKIIGQQFGETAALLFTFGAGEAVFEVSKAIGYEKIDPQIPA